MPGAPLPDIIPHWEAALERGTVTFEDLCQAIYGARRVDEASYREACERYFPLLLKSFQKEEGDLLSSYYCDDVIGGTALTRSGDGRYTLHTVYSVATEATAPIVALIPRCERMCVEASSVLKEPSRGTHADQVFSVSTYLLGLFDALATPGKITAENARAVLALQQEELSRTERELARLAQRDAQIVYFGGMLIGLVLTAAVGVSATWILQGTNVSVHARDEVMGAFAGGALGAFVSVLTRMTGSTLRLGYRTGRFYLRLLGAFRPVIGAVMALALTFLILSGILDIFNIPDASDGRFYFFAAIGFLAGFSERWAQDMLVVPQRATRASESGPSDAIATPVRPTPEGAESPPQPLPPTADRGETEE
jgi:hypothetical protein